MVFLLCSSIIEFFFNKKWLRVTLLILFFATFILLGSLRNNTVGLDTNGYSETYYNLRNNHNFIQYVFSKAPEVLFYGTEYIFSTFLKLPEIVFRIFYYGLKN